MTKQGAVFARLKGKGRHVTVYPQHCRGVDATQVAHPDNDIQLADADVLLKKLKWERKNEWTALEPSVYVAKVEAHE